MIQIEIEIPHLSQFMCLNLPPTIDTEALNTEIAVGTEAPADTEVNVSPLLLGKR